MASRAAETMLTDRGNGTRALATSGSVVVDQGLAADPVPLGRPINSLLAALPVVRHATAQFAYLRQSVRTNNAAVVADGATKPTSIYTVVKIEDQLDVVAHLSEGVPKYWLVDNASIAQFLGNEMRYGLQTAVESVVLSTVNATSGIVTQAYATSPLVTLRKSMTKLETNGYTAGAFVLTPADWESIELVLTSTNALEYQGLPFDPVARRLWGVPVVVTNAQAGGVSHTLATGAVAVDTDNVGVLIEWSETSNADDWSKNLIRARCEGRFAASVYQPAGVVVGDLTA
jgi:HK97 family phage major capsid protein